MGFWFTKPRSAPIKAKGTFIQGTPGTPSGRAQAPVLARLGCSACPLDKATISTPKMKPTLVQGGIYFLAEAPGGHEDETSHRPLTGPSGKLLRECIPEGEEGSCSFDNIINCRPPENRTPTWQEIQCCSSRRIKWIEQAKPKLIVGLGAIPLSWMLNSTDMAGMRGRLFVVKVGNHTCHFLPTYHPSFILRTAYDKRKPLKSKMGNCLKFDINRAFSLLPNLGRPTVADPGSIRRDISCFDGSSPAHFDEVTKLLRQAIKAPIKAVDLETKGLRPYAKYADVMTAAISFEDVNFSFAVDHPKSGWGTEQLIAILDLLHQLLKDDTIKVAHNAPFELEWFIWLLGKQVVNHAAWADTMVQAHILDERRGKQGKGDADSRRAVYQGLDFLVKQHFGITYKSTFKLNKKDMSKSDLGETLIYNGVDTKMTLALFLKQERLLKEQGLYDAYLEAIPRQASVALMQYLGIDVNQGEVKRIQGKLAGEIKAIEDEIASLKVVKAYVADHKEFNPAGAEVLTVFKDYLKCPEVEVKEKSGKVRYSVDKNVLDQIDHPLASLIINFRNRSKMLSTYVDELEFGKGSLVFPDGKVHTSFNTTFTETGRLSSDSPNLQNIPHRADSWIRKQFVPAKNHVLVAVDYGQLEGCTTAACSQDKAFVKALWENYDVHMDWAVRIAHKYPAIINGIQNLNDKKFMRKFRSVVKNKWTFPIIFGASNESLADYLNMPQDIIDDLVDEFLGVFHGLATWQKKTMKHYYDKGFVESPTGRRRYYPLNKNQAINHGIQSCACDIVCRGMNSLSMKAATTGEWHLHPHLNIHDDLSFIIPDDDKIIEESIEKIYRAMLAPGYAWLNVPLSVEVSIGTNWFEMQEIGKFWSHKDLD